MEGKERRKDLRVPFRTDIFIKHIGKKIRLGGDSVNLSLGGIMVETEEQIPVGSECRVWLSLSGTQEPLELTMDGTVVRQDVSGFGIHFDEMDLDSYTLLKEILRYNSGDPDSI